VYLILLQKIIHFLEPETNPIKTKTKKNEFYILLKMDWFQVEIEEMQNALVNGEELVILEHSAEEVDAMLRAAIARDFRNLVVFLCQNYTFYFIFDEQMVLAMSDEMLWILTHMCDLLSYVSNETITKWFHMNFESYPKKEYNKFDLIFVLQVTVTQTLGDVNRYKHRLNCVEILFGLSVVVDDVALFTELKTFYEPNEEIIEIMWNEAVFCNCWDFLHILFIDYGLETYSLYHSASTEAEIFLINSFIDCLEYGTANM
jgi:hypothetical protein